MYIGIGTMILIRSSSADRSVLDATDPVRRITQRSAGAAAAVGPTRGASPSGRGLGERSRRSAGGRAPSRSSSAAARATASASRSACSDAAVRDCRDPDEVKQLFTAPPEVLHPGRGRAHPRADRRAELGDPARRGRPPVAAQADAARLPRRADAAPHRPDGEVAEREVGGWPRDEPSALHPRLQALTLEVILRAVFGLDPGARLDGLRERLTEILELGAMPARCSRSLQRGRGAGAASCGCRDETDALLFELIDERRAETDGDSATTCSRCCSRRATRTARRCPTQELRDELMTLLVAGHETTASELAWAFERLARAPAWLARLAEEIDAGDGDAYLTATIQETLRRRPVLPNAAPRLVKQPVEIGGWTYPDGRLPGRQRLPDPPRPGDLPRPVRVPARALPRRAAGHLHLDPVRRRPPPLPRRELRACSR